MILTQDQCNEIISWHKIYKMGNVRECSDVCHPAGLHKSRLDYNISEVPRDPNTQWLFDYVADYLRSDFPNNTVSTKPFFYLHKFETGHKFTKHVDRDRQNDWKHIVGASLNSEYEGGKLITYNPDRELASNAGELYSMDASILHEVTEVTAGNRLSFVFFITVKELGLYKSIL